MNGATPQVSDQHIHRSVEMEFMCILVLLMATRNPVNSPVEVGSSSHYLQIFVKYLPGGFHRWISEPSRGMLGNRGMDVV